MTDRFEHLFAGLALLSITTLAAAQTFPPTGPTTSPSLDCEMVLFDYSSRIGDGDLSNVQALVSTHPQCFSGSVAAQATITATAIAHSNAISGSLAERFLAAAGPAVLASKGYSGLAAGAPADKWNVWGNLSGNDSTIEYTNTSASTTRNDSSILTTVIGADYALSPTLVFGLSASFDRGDGSGKTGDDASLDANTSGYLLAPYIGLQLSDELALDASAGFGHGKRDTQSGPKYDTDRRFAALNLSYSHWFQNLQLSGKLGYLHAKENYGNSRTNGLENPNTDNSNTLGQFRAGVQLGYWVNGFMPYAGVAFTRDRRSASNQYMEVDVLGKNATLWTVGVNFFSLSSKLSGGIAYNRESGRSNSKNDSLMANINIRY